MLSGHPGEERWAWREQDLRASWSLTIIIQIRLQRSSWDLRQQSRYLECIGWWYATLEFRQASWNKKESQYAIYQACNKPDWPKCRTQHRVDQFPMDWSWCSEWSNVVKDRHQQIDNEKSDQKEGIDREVANKRGSHVQSKFQRKKGSNWLWDLNLVWGMVIILGTPIS